MRLFWWLWILGMTHSRWYECNISKFVSRERRDMDIVLLLVVLQHMAALFWEPSAHICNSGVGHLKYLTALCKSECTFFYGSFSSFLGNTQLQSVPHGTSSLVLLVLYLVCVNVCLYYASIKYVHIKFMFAPCINNIRHFFFVQLMHTNYKILRLLK